MEVKADSNRERKHLRQAILAYGGLAVLLIAIAGYGVYVDSQPDGVDLTKEIRHVLGGGELRISAHAGEGGVQIALSRSAIGGEDIVFERAWELTLEDAKEIGILQSRLRMFFIMYPLDRSFTHHFSDSKLIQFCLMELAYD